MKPMENMTIKELQKVMDDSLFSEEAWKASQISCREALRGRIIILRGKNDR